MTLLYRILAGIGLLALCFAAGWLVRGHYARQELAAQLAKSNADTAAAVQAWRSTADRLMQQYEKEKTDAAAKAQQEQQAIDTAPGGDAPLSPYLSHAAGILWPSPHP